MVGPILRQTLGNVLELDDHESNVESNVWIVLFCKDDSISRYTKKGTSQSTLVGLARTAEPITVPI